jgi:hypothetical protein
LFGSKDKSQLSRLARSQRFPLVDSVNEIGLTGHFALNVSTDKPVYSAA